MPIEDSTERAIATRLIDAVLADGHCVTVWEGADVAIVKSRDRAAILDAMASTDSDVVRVYTNTGKCLGVVVLIYGNGEDLISDNSDNAIINAYCATASPPDTCD